MHPLGRLVDLCMKILRADKLAKRLVDAEIRQLNRSIQIAIEGHRFFYYSSEALARRLAEEFRKHKYFTSVEYSEMMYKLTISWEHLL